MYACVCVCVCVCVCAHVRLCKEWAKIHPALALQPLRSIAPPILVYPFVNPTLLMKRSYFPYGYVMVVTEFWEIMIHVMKS
jgi:hypothetical protein